MLKSRESQLEEELKKELQNYVQLIAKQFEEESKKESSGFDIERDLILSSSFVHKSKTTREPPSKGLEEVNKTL